MSEPIIEVRHLSKSFGTHVVLRDVDFTVNHGDVTCVIGASGSGKSTIARLGASLWDVSGGSITLGGVDIRKLTQEDYHRYIAYVSQDNFLFDTTVMENIRMGKQNATDAEVMEAAKACGCHAFILGLENGYDTVCTPEIFSQGQWQLLSIARAAVAEPSILLLDEITANLDVETEKEVLQALRRVSENRTVISISHRTSAEMGRIITV